MIYRLHMHLINLGDVAYETGVAHLTQVSGFPSISCAEVSLNSSKYNNISPVHAVAGMDWSAINSEPDEYTPNAVQTRVNGTVLTICTHIAGGNRMKVSPTAMWFAFQENLHYRTGGTIYGGNIPFETSITGAGLCKKLPVSIHRIALHVYTPLHFFLQATSL